MRKAVFVLVLFLISINILALEFDTRLAKSAQSSIIRLISDIQLGQVALFGQESPQSQVLIHEGDIVVNGSQKLTIKNCEFVQYGKIMIADNSTLEIENATLYIKNPQNYFRYGLIVTNQSSLLLANATLILAHGKKPKQLEQTVLIERNSTASILDSRITSPFKNAWVVSMYNSKISVQNSSFDNSTGLGIFDGSTGYIQDSTLTYQLNTARNSKLIVEDSYVNSVHGGEACDIQIKNCVIYSYSSIYWGSTLLVYNSSILSTFEAYSATAKFNNSSIEELVVNDYGSARLVRCSVSKTRALNNSTVWLINSDGGVISTINESEVFVGYDLPLFGVVLFPYTWIPMLQALMITLTITIVIIVILILKRCFRRHPSTPAFH